MSLLEPALRTPVENELEKILTSFDTAYAWRYASVKQGLRDLYEKAKRDQWNSTTELPWETQVEPESEIFPASTNPLRNYSGFLKLDAKEQARLAHAQVSQQLSQFLHGEQGALIVSSQLVSAVPWIDGKLYAGSQTMDEARHVEVFSRYLLEKLEWEWPINAELKELLDTVISESRWDFKYLGMQILIEGLAMAAFSHMVQLCREPLLRQLIGYVMRDESRHVAFGLISLREEYQQMERTELADREDFVVYVCDLMARRLQGGEIAEAMGWNVEEVKALVRQSPEFQLFQKLLFSRIVPNIKKLGLLTPRVREAFARLDILAFEHAGEEIAERPLGILD